MMTKDKSCVLRSGFLSRLIIPTAAIALATTVTVPAQAFDAKKHFKGQTIRLIVDFKPGGGTDIQARYYAANWGKFIPGNPRLRVSNLFPNPSGRNFVWKSKPDGLTLSFVASASVGKEMVDKTAKFETAKFVQIGTHAKRDVVLLGRGTLPYNSLREAKGSSVKIVLAEPIAAATDLDSKLLAVTLLGMWMDAPMKIASVARSGTADTLLMLERGDITGWIAGSQWYALPKMRPGWFKKGYLKPLADLGHPAAPAIPNSEIKMTLPNAHTWLTAEQKKLWEGIVLPGIIYGKAITAPPGLPADITKVLRDSYAKAVNDPVFGAGLEKIQGQPIAFIHGAKMQKLVAEATVAFKKTLPDLNRLHRDVYSRYFKGVKVPTIPENIAGVIKSVQRGGRFIKVSGHRVRMTSSRTKITLNGQKIKRKALKVGMTCKIKGAVRKGKYEGRKVVCN
jgi:tripartite-type tricarboxylate transporter receptor subunit TctC